MLAKNVIFASIKIKCFIFIVDLETFRHFFKGIIQQ